MMVIVMLTKRDDGDGGDGGDDTGGDGGDDSGSDSVMVATVSIAVVNCSCGSLAVFVALSSTRRLWPAGGVRTRIFGA